MKKTYAIAALALTSCLVLGTAAASQAYNVTATFRPDMKLKVNGTTYTVRDTTGKEVSPLIYNGTTYLPLANLGQLLGAQVSWDEATQTVIITDNASTSAAGAASYIGEAKAKETALSHAGLTASQVTFLEVKLDWENGRQVYEVEFYSGNKEYDYEIDASAGTVLSYDFDIENFAPSTSTNTGANTGSSAVIGEAKAKEIALNHAGLSANQVSFVQTKLDWENGRQVYEVEFYSGNKEYYYEIDASAGTVLSYDFDIENYTIPSTGTSSGSYISREKAQQLAQAKAPNATLVKLELDFDDGRAVYEGELRDGRTEYEFEIDAVTGSFIKWSQDWD